MNPVYRYDILLFQLIYLRRFLFKVLPVLKATQNAPLFFLSRTRVVVPYASRWGQIWLFLPVSIFPLLYFCTGCFTPVQFSI